MSIRFRLPTREEEYNVYQSDAVFVMGKRGPLVLQERDENGNWVDVKLVKEPQNDNAKNE